MALALYRKYRPRTFAEVIGQEQVTEPLMQALRTGRLNHAYLFSGPRGCGKTSSARILARSLNCVKGPTPEPCGECDSCVALAPDGPGSIDVIEIDAASHGGVDDARDLRERAFFAPAASRFKVYVIDEAHMVSTQGFNALLKLVEEPPEYVTFIFATTEPEKVLATIKSRTHHYPFRLVPPSVLRPYLEKLAREEGVSVEPAVFPLVVRAGGGSVRDSLSVLDQLIAGAGVYGVTYNRAVGLLGVTDVGLIDEMTDALAAGDGAAAFATVDRVAEAGHDPRRYTSDLLERFRDLIIMQKVPDAAATGIIDAPDDQLERMNAQASRMGSATLSRLADIVHNGLTEMRGTTAPRLLLELLVARMLLPGADDSQGALLQRLERMERRLGAADPGPEPGHESTSRLSNVAGVAAPPARSAGQPAPAVSPSARTVSRPALVAEAASGTAEPARPASDRVPDADEVSAAEPGISSGTASHPSEPAEVTQAAEPAAPGALDAAAVRRVWDEVLSTVRRRSPRAWAVVREAVVRDVHGEELVLVFQHAVHANMFGAQADLLVEAVREVFGGSWRVRAELGSDDRAGAGRTPAAATPPVSTPPGGRPVDSGPPAEPGSADGGGWPTPARLGGAVTDPAGTADDPPTGHAPGGGRPSPGATTRGAGPTSSAAPSVGSAVGDTGAGGAISGGAISSGATEGGATASIGTAGGTTASGATSVDGRASGARTGGGRADGARTGGGRAGGATAGGGRAGGATTGGGRAGASAGGGTRTGTGAPARAGAGTGARRPGAGAAPRRAETARASSARGSRASASEVPPPDEPPFDPDYDRPPTGRAFEGFDPGDEPLDDAVDPSQARQSSEEQAIKLLTEQLGAERISGE